MITLREAMEHLVNDNYGRNQDYRRQSVAWQLPIDAYADDDAIVITADVPGLKPEELQVTMESNTLTIRGELKNRPEGRNYLLSERATSSLRARSDHQYAYRLGQGRSGVRERGPTANLAESRSQQTQADRHQRHPQ